VQLHKLAAQAPIGASVLMEAGSVGQVVRMWRVHSALGQNPWSWASVLAALLLYCWHYRVCAPQLVWARRACWLSVVVVGAVLITVLYFNHA